jgi:hypothetical protein
MTSPRAWQAAADTDVVDNVEDEVVAVFFFRLSEQSSRNISPVGIRSMLAAWFFFSLSLTDVMESYVIFVPVET